MATRRRTQKVRHYREGGAVPIEDVLPGFGREEPEARAADVPAPSPPPEPEPDIPPSENSDAVLQAIMGQRRAEQVQAEAMQRAAVEQPAQPTPPQPAPQMSERRIAFIREHPELLDPANREAVEGYWRQAQRMNIHDEAEVDRFVLQGVHWEQRQREPRREEPEPAPSYAEPPQSQREAFQEPPPEPRRSPPEPRRSMPVTAPVQRSVPSISTGKARQSQLHLTEDERKIARSSFVDRPDLPRMTNAQKEYLYAQQKAKYEAMKASGEYTDQRQR
jgi:hypothetical protein